MSLRTDLAAELRSSLPQDFKGITQTELARGGLDIVRTKVESEEAARALGKPVGRYVTITSKSGSLETPHESFEDCAAAIAEEISLLCGKFHTALVIGLGNRSITPDRLGPEVADKILATRHIHRFARELDTDGLADISVISPGVMGQTGLEAAEIAKAVADTIHPDVIIAADALCCSEYNNLGSCLQLCDTGISPGSGVENARAEFSLQTMGAPTVAIGIPTVIDASVLSGNKACEKMFVTPRNIDTLVSRAAALTAAALNLTLHPSLTLGEISSLVG